MSIKDHAKEQAEQGLLIPLIPRSPRAMIRRALYLSRELWDEIEGGDDASFTAERKAQLRADLEVIVSSRTIDPKYCYWLTPQHDCVWEIRSTRDDPSTRILGCFAAQDVFVATNMQRRDLLGGWDSEEWKLAKRNALVIWRKILYTYPPMGANGEQIDDFFTGALQGKYFK